MATFHSDDGELVQQLMQRYHADKDVRLSSYADWYLQAFYVYDNLPVQHPAKYKWRSIWEQRRYVWERYLDVLARDEDGYRKMSPAK